MAELRCLGILRLVTVCVLAGLLGTAGRARTELMAYWPLDEVVEGKTPDERPRGHHAVLHALGGNLPAVEEGIAGNALRFTAKNQQHLLPNPSLRLPDLKTFTAMAWIWPAQDKVVQEVFCQKEEHWASGKDAGWRLRYFWQAAIFALGRGAQRFRITGKVHDVKPRQWTHLAATFDGKQMRLYTNGTLLGSCEVEGEWRNSELPLVIGGFCGPKHHYAFDGLLDELRLYDHVLTEDEIVRVAAAKLSAGRGREEAARS